MTEQQADLIMTDPDVVHGQARIRDTRIPVSVVLDCLAAGLSEDEILGQPHVVGRGHPGSRGLRRCPGP